MFALPPPRRPSEDALVRARFNDLHANGYIVIDAHGKCTLTEKGWRTLSAAAQARAPRPPRPTKANIERELAELNHARTAMGC